MTRKSTTIAKPHSTPSGKESWKPHKGQKLALKYVLERTSAALFLDPGFGKTSISYAALKVLKNQELLRGALVIAPRRPAVSTWPDEQARWAEFEGLDVCVIRGPKREQQLATRHDVYIVTYEGFDWLIKSGWLKTLLKKRWLCTLIIDELSKLKNHNSVRHKNVAEWGDRFKRRWGLTGSPASNGLLNLFGELYVLDSGRALGKFFTHYRAMFFTPVNPDADFPRFEPAPGAEELIYERIKPTALRLDAKDYYDMPQFVPNLIKDELSPEAQEVYDGMEQEMFAFLDEQTIVTATTAAAASMKCQQIASGAIYEDKVDPVTGMPRAGKRLWDAVHDGKLGLLAELIDSLEGQQLLVAYWFGHDLVRIQGLMKKLYGGEMPAIGSSVSDKKAIAYEKAWNGGEIPIMLCQPASVGHGMNFQRGNAYNLCWYTLPNFDFEIYDQFNRRLRRQGSKAANVFAHHLIMKGTVDEVQYASMNSKRRGQDRLFDALDAMRRRRK